MMKLQGTPIEVRIKMALTKTQIIGLVTIVAVAGVATSLILIFDPFTPRYTLTIVNPSYPCCSDYGNVTITPPGINGSTSPYRYEFKANTEVELTIYFSDPLALDFTGWTGPDASLVQTVTAGHSYKIVMSANINITANWNCHC